MALRFGCRVKGLRVPRRPQAQVAEPEASGPAAHRLGDREAEPLVGTVAEQVQAVLAEGQVDPREAVVGLSRGAIGDPIPEEAQVVRVAQVVQEALAVQGMTRTMKTAVRTGVAVGRSGVKVALRQQFRRY